MIEQQRLKKKTAVLLAICVLMVISYFSVIRATQCRHECTGGECRICHVLQSAKSWDKSLGVVIAKAAAGCLRIGTAGLLAAVTCSYVCGRTLVSDKVRCER